MAMRHAAVAAGEGLSVVEREKVIITFFLMEIFCSFQNNFNIIPITVNEKLITFKRPAGNFLKTLLKNRTNVSRL